MKNPVTCLSNVCGVAVKCALNTLIIGANLVALVIPAAKEYTDSE